MLHVAPNGVDHDLLAERWTTDASHHGYLDLYGNRCERVVIPAGDSRIVYEADVVLHEPLDPLAPDTPETPIM